MPVRAWSTERCEEYLDERIRLHQTARLHLPPCSFAERWATKDVWAVRKAGRDRALRVLESEAEAVALVSSLGAGHDVEHRPGRNLRCESYCPVAGYCDQWFKNKG